MIILESTELWQFNMIHKIKGLLENKKEVQAVILKGSFCDKSISVDRWSDIDLVVVVSDENINSIFPKTDWILPLGKIFALEQFPGDLTMTSRICLEGYRRFDFVFIKYSNFKDINKWDFNPIGQKYEILFSKIADLEKSIGDLTKNKNYQEPNPEAIDNMANNFWLKGVVAIAKIAREDYLIAGHLALEMAQDCIVLQMMLRDREKGTNIHRLGARESIEIFSSIRNLGKLQPPEDIIMIIEDSALTFDKLAKTYSPEYIHRYNEFEKWLYDLKKALNMI